MVTASPGRKIPREIREGHGEALIAPARQQPSQLPGREIIIVADHYDAKGRTIDVSGDDGASNAPQPPQ